MGANRLVVVGLLGVLVAGGCGGNGSTDSVPAAEQGTVAVSAGAGVGDSTSVSAGGTALTPGTSGSSSATVAVPRSSQPAEPMAAAKLPSVDVIDVASGATLSLASLIASDRPTLLWMWAPH